MRNLDEDRKAIDIDECDLYRPKGFTTVAIAHNSEIGRLCAIRKLDQSTKSQRVFFLEFYNTINKPCVVLEWKYLSKKAAFETLIWLGNSVVVGCSDGSLLMLSPFNYKIKRFPICASPIVAAVTISSSQIAIGSESSEVKLLELDAEGNLIVNKTVKFTSEQRVVSLAASLKFSCLAVGLIDSIILVQIPSAEQFMIKVPQHINKSTVVWSLLFVDDFLLSGDSRGKVMIHNPKSGALIKIIHSHQADILSMVASKNQVYVAGTDYRIQILSQVASTNEKLEWNTVGQKIVNENDIRCMTIISQFLVTAGAEHRILLSDNKHHVFNVENQPGCSVTEDGKLIFIPYLDRIEMWKRPLPDAQTSSHGDVSVFDLENGPKLLLAIEPKRDAIILHSAFSPDGQHVILSTESEVFIYKLSLQEDGKYEVKKVLSISRKESEPVSALYATNSALYFAHGCSILECVKFETLERKIVAARECDSMIVKIVVDSSDKHCLLSTTRSEVLFVKLKSDKVDTDERFEKLEIAYVPSDFKLHVTKKGDPLAIFIVYGYDATLNFLNLKTHKEMKSPINLGDFTGNRRSIFSNASNIVDNSIALQETRGSHCIVGQLNEVQSFVFSLHGEQKELTEESKMLLPPFPFEVHYTANEESGSASILAISSQPENPPTCTPINIRRFNRQ